MIMWNEIELDFLAEFEGEKVNPIQIFQWFKSRPEFSQAPGRQSAEEESDSGFHGKTVGKVRYDPETKKLEIVDLPVAENKSAEEVDVEKLAEHIERFAEDVYGKDKVLSVTEWNVLDDYIRYKAALQNQEGFSEDDMRKCASDFYNNGHSRGVMYDTEEGDQGYVAPLKFDDYIISLKSKA